MFPSSLPPLDCHAHIAPDVTTAQLSGLNGALVFAVTRTPAEALAASRRADATLLWGFGAHPALPGALAALDPQLLESAVDTHVLIGEIGLDRRGPTAAQQDALEAVLGACQGRPVLLSLHSTGRTRQVLDALRQQPHPGAILHWFNGSAEQIAEGVELGCYFSVNNAMDDTRLALIPRRRMLPETDFPASRKATQADRPGDIRALERRLSTRDGSPQSTIRAAWYRNLDCLVTSAGVRSRLPGRFQEVLDAAAGT